jgi:hypothetical protein
MFLYKYVVVVTFICVEKQKRESVQREKERTGVNTFLDWVYSEFAVAKSGRRSHVEIEPL